MLNFLKYKSQLSNVWGMFLITIIFDTAAAVLNQCLPAEYLYLLF